MAKNLIGTTFRSVYADGNPLWRVTKKVGPNAWEAVCDDEDWGGTVKLFSTKEIENHKNFEKHIDDVENEQERFYNSLKVGKTIHYCNGFKQYVECVVVQKDGKNVLKPVALKGEWRGYDLPHRMVDGTIDYGYHAKQIMEGKTFTPNYSCVLEYSGCGYRKDNIPEQVTKMPRINLDVAKMGEKETKVAELIQSFDFIEKELERGRQHLVKTKDYEGVSSSIVFLLEGEVKNLKEKFNHLL